MMELGRILLLLTPAVPLLLALMGPWTSRPARLLPLAALPGLLAAVVSPHPVEISLPDVFLGAGLRLDPLGAIFLGFAAFLWLCAGVYANAYLGGKRREHSFCIFWNLTLAGTLGAFCAADAVTFYIAFSFLSLAAYILIVHDGTEAAQRAGRIYIVLAVFGEMSLLVGLLIGADAADSILIADIRTALAVSPWGDYAILGLLLGFGLKAGLVPLHVWLPLAHSAAPVPASAVLSGAIVKAGIMGLIRFLPMEAASPFWADLLTWLGLLTAYYGVLAGLPQSHPKPVLAYSTLSQMGLLVAVLGAGLGSPGTDATHAIAALYVTHHGLAKGALFLAVGLVAASGRRTALPTLLLAAILGAAIAGLPFTGGALAKLAIKGPLGDGAAATLASLSAIGTMLLILRFLFLLLRHRSQDEAARPGLALVLPFAALALAALVLPWLLFPRLAGQSIAYAIAPEALWAALWPILLAVAIAAGALRLRRQPVQIPLGDIVILAEAAVGRIAGVWRRGMEQRSFAYDWSGLMRLTFPIARLERAMMSWYIGGTAVLIVAVLLGLAL